MNSDWSEYKLLDFPGACYWDGEAPFCEGNCPEGYDECGRDDCGDGEHDDKDTRNCPEKAMKISHFNPNQSAPSIYIMIELCYFSLDQ